MTALQMQRCSLWRKVLIWMVSGVARDAQRVETWEFDFFQTENYKLKKKSTTFSLGSIRIFFQFFMFFLRKKDYT